MAEYRSSIPETATEQVVERYETGQPKRAAYRRDGVVVGVRFFHEDGAPSFESPLLEGRLHGVQYRWDHPGVLLSAEPFAEGLPHGTAMQWADDGTLVGSYTMIRGTGLDLWWGCSGGQRSLSEARSLHNGLRHGFEWWIHPSQDRVTEERHCWEGQLHGSERQWNRAGRLQRGYPRYYVHGQRVDKRHYLRACSRHPELPPFRASDNLPQRSFPPEVAQHLPGARDG
jgi:antitoxin component YwqK of YwqJK toxin-antitoxin module